MQSAPLAESDPGSVPFQWSLLAWAGLVGLLTGLAVVAFHELVGLINSALFGPLVEGLLSLGRAPLPPPPAMPPALLPSLPEQTPLTALVQIGLGGLGYLPPPPPAAELPPAPLAGLPRWLQLWPVVVVPCLGGLAVGLLRRWRADPGPGLPSLMAMADGAVPAAPQLPFQRLLAASLSLGSGASLGPEGPSVESGGNLGLWL
ncbi:MAG: chloride channel protein, partial [Prochlorococcaceae cyanobacterium]